MMASKVIILSVTLFAWAQAGAILQQTPIVAQYSPATAVSTSYHSQSTQSVQETPLIAQAAPIVTKSAVAVTPLTLAQPAALTIHDPAVGSHQQTVIRGLGGTQTVSHYSKAVDSAFSSVRKYDMRITNDALSLIHAPVVAHTAPVIAHTVPVIAHSAPLVAEASPAFIHHAPTFIHTSPAVAVALAEHVVVAPAEVVAHVSFSGMGANYAW